jgi:N-6 DNA methylase
MAPPAGYGDHAFILHIVASLTDDGHAGIVCPQGVLFRGQPEVEEETDEFDDDGNPKIKRRKADDFRRRRYLRADSFSDAQALEVCPIPTCEASTQAEDARHPAPRTSARKAR